MRAGGVGSGRAPARRPAVAYLHTLDGVPAHFDGRQVVYPGPRTPLRTCASLRELRAQQRASREYRGPGVVVLVTRPVYGHVRVRVP